ncbi:MAG: hypothetical protein AAF514_09340, partial [Verrucomicrobiota bacterium]
DRKADWTEMIKNQLGRRNLSPDQASLLRGKLYRAQKKETPNPEGENQHSKVVKGQNDPQPTTAQKVAKQTGVSEKTVKRDAQFAEAVETLGPEKEKEIMAGKRKEPKSEVIKQAKAKTEGKANPSNRQNVGKQSTAEKVAEQTGVTARTVERDSPS